MKRSLSILLAMIVVFCTLSSVTATVYADYDANLVAHQKMDNILQNYVDPSYHLDNYDDFTESEEAELRAVVGEVITGCTTEYEKISAVTKFVAENIYYDFDFYEGRTSTTYIKPYEVWTNKRTICDGYSRLTKALLNFTGVPCMRVLADDHAYNVAYDSENNRWIYLDATWCSGNKYSYGEYTSGTYKVSHFDMSLELLSRLSNHEFYILEGIYIDDLTYYIETPNNADWANLDEWHVSVSGHINKKNVSAIHNIISSLDEFPVTNIKYCAFSDCTSLTSCNRLPKGA